MDSIRKINEKKLMLNDEDKEFCRFVFNCNTFCGGSGNRIMYDKLSERE